MLGGGQDYFYLREPMIVDMQQGLTIKIGKINFIIVHHWLPQQDLSQLEISFKITIPTNTKVLMSNGISVIIGDDIHAELSVDSVIKVIACTKIQQLDDPIRLVLDDDANATIIHLSKDVVETDTVVSENIVESFMVACEKPGFDNIKSRINPIF